MNEYTSSLLQDIYDYNIPNIDIDNTLIHPNYFGQSILNIPSSICKLLNIPETTSPALKGEILSPLGNETENVIFIMIDALSYSRLQKWMDDDDSLVWNQLRSKGVFAPITSISPSTTAAATTTFWSGASPSQHGIVGYELLLKEYRLVANMILHRPSSFEDGIGNLALAGFVPEDFLPLKTFGTHLMENGVQPHSFQHFSIFNSGLSRSFIKHSTLHSTDTHPSIWIKLIEMLENTKGQKTYSWIYWGDMDKSAHLYGPDDIRPKNDFQEFSDSFEKYFLDKIPDYLKKNTTIIVGADHGQIATNNKNPDYDLRNHPEFTNLLHIYPTGENRLAYLHVRPGKIDEVKNYIYQSWPNKFSILDSEEAMLGGLFGPKPFAPNLLSRLGDLIVISREDAYLWWKYDDNNLIGRHGGLSEQEMIVPFLSAKLA